MTGSNMSECLADAMCQRCQARFAPTERIVNSNGELYHEHCFVCAQCFRPFPEGLFYEFEGRKYCEHDFQMLFAPCCGFCGEFVIGRVIKAMNTNWHPGCFRCELCDVELADLGFVKNAGRHDLISHLRGKALGELPATPLCPEVLSIAVDLFFISGQDRGGEHQVLSLASSDLTAGPSYLNHLLSQ
ncbi:hypothetical protein U0070_013321 [Myodes glareolus]|uniref:LIM zinc-binding domain-containing protein n=1 Tax=Myodes glareolus TaxID=447135 RepID=A0AAW0JS96_MYOGA